MSVVWFSGVIDPYSCLNAIKLHQWATLLLFLANNLAVTSWICIGISTNASHVGDQAELIRRRGEATLESGWYSDAIMYVPYNVELVSHTTNKAENVLAGPDKRSSGIQYKQCIIYSKISNVCVVDSCNHHHAHPKFHSL